MYNKYNNLKIRNKSVNKKQLTANEPFKLKDIIITAMISGIHEIVESSEQITNNAGQLPDKAEKSAAEFKTAAM